MGLFSRDKKEEKHVEGNEFDVPPVLPETVVDKTAAYVSSEKPQKPADVHRIIPQDIVHSPVHDRSRISEVVRMVPENRPVPETAVSDGPVSVAADDSQGQQGLSSDNSFFSELERRFLANKDEFHKYITDDLIHKMKDFHESVNSGTGFFLHEDDVDYEIRKKIQALKLIEEEWIIRKKEFEATEALLLEKEIQLESRLNELKNTFGAAEKFKYYQKKVPEHVSFVLSNNLKIHSIQELIYELTRMDDDVFYSHVNNERNDFYNWIKDVFHDEKLANHVKNVRSRQDMINLLKSFN